MPSLVGSEMCIRDRVLLLTTAAAVFLRLYRHAGGRKPRERAVTSLVHLAEDSR